VASKRINHDYKAGLIVYIIGFAQGKDKLGSLLKIIFSPSAFTPFYILAILGGVQTILYFGTSMCSVGSGCSYLFLKVYWVSKKRGIFGVLFVFALINIAMSAAVGKY
jgi:hypothetical protein